MARPPGRARIVLPGVWELQLLYRGAVSPMSPFRFFQWQILRQGILVQVVYLEVTQGRTVRECGSTEVQQGRRNASLMPFMNDRATVVGKWGLLPLGTP